MTINTSVTPTSVFAVTNPATGEIIQHISNMGVEEVEIVIQKAAHALPPWRSKTGKERAALLRGWFNLIKDQTDDLAKLMTLEQGKPIKEAIGEVAYAASFIEWFAEEAKRVTGAIPSSTWSDKRMLVLKQPIGVCAAITPWNFPLAMITRKVGPALAAGCTIIIKPAEQTPLSALALAELAKKAGIPDGVINVVTCDSANSIEVGKLICASPVVKHLSFTGSTAVGKILMSQCASTVKKIALELGGHAPFIVFEDADLEAAVEGAIQSKYRNSGQTCVCSNRFYVHKNLYEQFIEKMAIASKELVVGNGLIEGVNQGPLIDEDAVLKVELQVQDALKKGARIVAGGKRHAQGGSFFEPTVLADVDESMLVMREETFGPVVAIKSFSSEEDVIAAANNSDFGLASYFYSRDISRIWRVAEAMEFGMVGVNTGIISNEVAPFGGVKQSGLGREGSSWGIDEYLEMKYICLSI
jgi:succinate-semialdehyde dehydrogenase / glutarate-semialdehyde dehydrogenase